MISIFKHSRIKRAKLNDTEGINWENQGLMDYAK